MDAASRYGRNFFSLIIADEYYIEFKVMSIVRVQRIGAPRCDPIRRVQRFRAQRMEGRRQMTEGRKQMIEMTGNRARKAEAWKKGGSEAGKQGGLKKGDAGKVRR